MVLSETNRQETERSKHSHYLSLVIPFYNEEDCSAPLVMRIHTALSSLQYPWELILVDDGSIDNTLTHLRDIRDKYGDHIRVLEFSRNFGQTAAMQAGIDNARGDIIATMDGDMQNDPHDIPRMVERLVQDELDLLAGWRKNRKDDFLLRKVPSYLANKLIAKITGVVLHDYGCSLKVFRASVVKNIRLYGEMHRFIPAWIATNTTPERIKEEVVTHHSRSLGTSKYGISRTFRVLLDLLSVYFFMRFNARPGHFFGMVGLFSGGVGALVLGYLFILKIIGESIGTRPLLQMGILLIIMSIQFFSIGIIGELLSRIYFETKDRKPYIIRNSEENDQDDSQSWMEVKRGEYTK